MRKSFLALLASLGLLTTVLYSCSKSSEVKSEEPCFGMAGPKFTAVRQVVQSNCVSCHNSTTANGGMNWTVDCNIVANSGKIKTKAVDAHGTPTQMPPPPAAGLSASDRQKITDWIAAGGRYTD
jgi:uncharacterized membrane protein